MQALLQESVVLVLLHHRVMQVLLREASTQAPLLENKE
jgi:hypothetical protein